MLAFAVDAKLSSLVISSSLTLATSRYYQLFYTRYSDSDPVVTACKSNSKSPHHHHLIDALSKVKSMLHGARVRRRTDQSWRSLL